MIIPRPASAALRRKALSERYVTYSTAEVVVAASSHVTVQAFTVTAGINVHAVALGASAGIKAQIYDVDAAAEVASTTDTYEMLARLKLPPASYEFRLVNATGSPVTACGFLTNKENELL